MKKKYFTIEAGTVKEVSALCANAYPFHIEATTKAEASVKLLEMAEHAIRSMPMLRFRNGAWQMITACRSGFMSETGRVERGGIGLCVAVFETRLEADNDSSFSYYASEDYVNQMAPKKAPLSS